MEKDKVVPPESTTGDKAAGTVESPVAKLDDKETNLANLRRKNEALEKELATLKGGDAPAKTGSDPLEIIFTRDLKEASRQFAKQNKVSAEEWATMKEKINFNGDETMSEIMEKIQDTYESIPTVKKRKETELIEKGKKLAMLNIQDHELDFSGGGNSDAQTGEQTTFNQKERKWLSAFGVSQDDRNKIDKKKTSYSEWTEGQSPVRKFFSK